MKGYERKSSEVRELVNNIDPNVMANALTKGSEGLHGVVPNIAQSLQVTGAKALNYLHQQMPKPQQEMVGDPEWEPSKLNKTQWLDVHDIVNDPVSALDHVRHGTLSSRHMDALNQVHPELLNEMRQKVMEQMDPKKVQKLPSSTKTALSNFLGSPITSASTPQMILSNQSMFQAKNALAQSIAPKSPKSTVGGLDKLNLGERASTETTELEEND